jgi:hypothetical protein
MVLAIAVRPIHLLAARLAPAPMRVTHPQPVEGKGASRATGASIFVSFFYNFGDVRDGV